jgi:uncharacterized protein YjbJ (UPF0337 family)
VIVVRLEHEGGNPLMRCACGLSHRQSSGFFLGTALRPLAGIYLQEHLMSINKDQVKGRIEETKGSIKEATGKLVGDETLETKGNIQKNLGKVQEKLGDIRQNAKDSLK